MSWKVALEFDDDSAIVLDEEFDSWQDALDAGNEAKDTEFFSDEDGNELEVVRVNPYEP